MLSIQYCIEGIYTRQTFRRKLSDEVKKCSQCLGSENMLNNYGIATATNQIFGRIDYMALNVLTFSRRRQPRRYLLTYSKSRGFYSGLVRRQGCESKRMAAPFTYSTGCSAHGAFKTLKVLQGSTRRLATTPVSQQDQAP